MRAQGLSDRQKLVGLVAFIACGVVAAGSLGTWGTRGFDDLEGWDANGGFTLVLAILAALGMVSQYWRGTVHRAVTGIMLVVFALIVVVVLYDWANLTDYFDGRGTIEYGWGLYAVLAGGVTGVLVCLYQFARPKG